MNVPFHWWFTPAGDPCPTAAPLMRRSHRDLTHAAAAEMGFLRSPSATFKCLSQNILDVWHWCLKLDLVAAKKQTPSKTLGSSLVCTVRGCERSMSRGSCQAFVSLLILLQRTVFIAAYTAGDCSGCPMLCSSCALERGGIFKELCWGLEVFHPHPSPLLKHDAFLFVVVSLWHRVSWGVNEEIKTLKEQFWITNWVAKHEERGSCPRRQSWRHSGADPWPTKTLISQALAQPVPAERAVKCWGENPMWPLLLLLKDSHRLWPQCKEAKHLP